MDPVTRSPARALVGGVLSVIELWGRGQVGNALGTYSDEVWCFQRPMAAEEVSLSRSTFWISPSLRVFFGPSQAHYLLCNEKWDCILTTSGSPHLPRDGSPVLSHVFYCSVTGTSRHPTAQAVVLCGVLSAWNSLCPMSTGQTRTCTPPHPKLAVILFSFD